MRHLPLYRLAEGRKGRVLGPRRVPVVAARVEHLDGQVGQGGGQGCRPVVRWGGFDCAEEDEGGPREGRVGWGEVRCCFLRGWLGGHVSLAINMDRGILAWRLGFRVRGARLGW